MTISRWNERWLAGLALTWGVILMLPGDLFAGIERYALLARVFPDWLWGALYFAGGFLIMFVPSQRVHKHTHFGLCCLWVCMTALSLLSTFTPATLLITSLVFVIAMFHVGKFFRLGHPPPTRP